MSKAKAKELPPIEYYVDTPNNIYVGPFLDIGAAQTAALLWRVADVITADQIDRTTLRVQLLGIRNKGWAKDSYLDVDAIQTPYLRDMVTRLKHGGMP